MFSLFFESSEQLKNNKQQKQRQQTFRYLLLTFLFLKNPPKERNELQRYHFTNKKIRLKQNVLSLIINIFPFDKMICKILRYKVREILCKKSRSISRILYLKIKVLIIYLGSKLLYFSCCLPLEIERVTLKTSIYIALHRIEFT